MSAAIMIHYVGQRECLYIDAHTVARHLLLPHVFQPLTAKY